ncbi:MULTISPECIES: hypothetical protein [unclassified Isoptericola]|uniref:hypothetical protein n=1 Tax=unclassified Isoptericola TaxID=2623355 RepID=UPI0036515203
MSVGTEPASPRTRRRAWWWMTLALVVLLAAGATVGALWLAPPRQTAEVTVPPADAAPEQVVRAYLEAVAAHDCDTAAALTAGGATDFCDDTRSLEILEVVPAPHLSDGDLSAVNTDFEATWRPFSGVVDVPEEGWGWTYYLAHGPEGWRIVDAGTG